MINSGVVAGIHVAGVRGDRCGAVQHCIAATTLELIVGILNSVFFNFFFNFKYSVTLARCRRTP